MKRIPLSTLFLLPLLTLLPVMAQAASPSAAVMNARTQERLAHRIAAQAVSSARAKAVKAVTEAVDLPVEHNSLRDEILARFRRSSSSSSSKRSSSSRSSVSSAPSAPVSTLIQEVMNLVNQERSKAGLSALTSNGLLANAAKAHAQDMKDQNYFDHTGRDGRSPTQRMKDAGYPQVPSCNCRRQYFYGENIAKGQKTAVQVMKDWMNSPGHRANILSKDFREIGIGIVDTYWVQDFGGVWDR